MQPNQESTYQLIEGCKAGNRNAQEQLYKAYYRAMASLCMRYTKNEADAVEVLNTGFLKVFKNISRYDAAKASLYTWIRIIIINSCLDFIKAKSKPSQFTDLAAATDVPIPAEALSKLTADGLLQLVQSLPPATRAVFNLYAIDGFSHKEIAALLNIGEGTSKCHLSEGRKKLQHLIQQDVTPT